MSWPPGAARLHLLASSRPRRSHHPIAYPAPVTGRGPQVGQDSDRCRRTPSPEEKLDYADTRRECVGDAAGSIHRLTVPPRVLVGRVLSHWSHHRYTKPSPAERLLETVRFLKENTRRNNSYVRVCSSVALCSHGPSASCRVLSAWFDVVLLCCFPPALRGGYSYSTVALLPYYNVCSHYRCG